MVRVTDIKRGFLDLTGTKKVDLQTYEEFRKRYEPIIGDILLTRVGSYGNSCYINRANEFCLGQNTVCISPNRTMVRPFYLYSCLNSPFVKDQINALVGGASQPTISLKNIGSLDIPFPEKPTQEKIAAILSAYDDLIENNKRRIKILEEMAQTLYREWFVKFRFPGHQKVKMVNSPLGKIPEGWEVSNLGNESKNFDRMRKPLSKMQREKRPGP
jgi:type I restriction enzyme S subunit